MTARSKRTGRDRQAEGLVEAGGQTGLEGVPGQPATVSRMTNTGWIPRSPWSQPEHALFAPTPTRVRGQRVVELVS
ncbi:unnamed protein product [Lota lota]